MNREFWNSRYSEDEFAYGTQANDFLREQAFTPGGTVLCLAEGQGRNGVYLAEQGYEVTCVDYSEEGLRRMNELAEKRNVSIKTVCADLNDYDPGKDEWDGIVIIFGHFPPDLRKKVHGKLYEALKKDGKLIIEAYSKEQLNFKTGGPMNEQMLYSRVELLDDLKDFNSIDIKEIQREVIEGQYHHGRAAVVQVIAVKK